jgi:hypothetical protein
MNTMQNKDYKVRDHRNNNNHDNTGRSTNRRNQRPNQKLKKPRSGFIKANCDANLSVDGRWGLGAIFRDEKGQVVASATWERSGFNDPATAEAFALYLTTRLAAECCFTSVEFESDCFTVVKSVNSPEPSSRSYFGNMIRGVQVNIARFRQCSFKHIDRKANRAAHSLAGLAHSNPDYIRLEETHPLIVPIVLMDLFYYNFFSFKKKKTSSLNLLAN